MSEDPSRTRAYEPGSTPFPQPDATRPYAPGTAPYQQPPYQPPPGQQPPYQQPPGQQSPYGQAPYGPPAYGPPPYAPPPADVAQERARAQRSIVFGVLWLAGGLLLSLITYSMASKSGGVYFVAYGPVIYGVVRIVIGLVALNRAKP